MVIICFSAIHDGELPSQGVISLIQLVILTSQPNTRVPQSGSSIFYNGLHILIIGSCADFESRLRNRVQISQFI